MSTSVIAGPSDTNHASLDVMQDVQTPAIHTRELNKSYGNTVALQSLSMTVGRGEIFGFLGPNGAGKTTAVKLLVGLSEPTSGEGWVLGQTLGNVEVRRRIGYLPELFRYQDWLSGREVLDLHCKLARIPKSRRPEEIAQALDLSGLTERADDRVGTYSKGMQQRLGLGVSLLGTPELVFLDEPTSALDPVGRHDVREIIHKLKARGVAVFLNSHMLTEVEQVCDRVAIVDKGQIIAIGTLAELRGRARSVRIRVDDPNSPAIQSLGFAPHVRTEGNAILLTEVGEQEIPEIIYRLVGQGVRIYAVEPIGGSLEDGFLNLLESHDSDPDHSPAHPS